MKRLRTRTNELPRILQSTTREYQPRHSKAAEAKLHLQNAPTQRWTPMHPLQRQGRSGMRGRAGTPLIRPTECTTRMLRHPPAATSDWPEAGSGGGTGNCRRLWAVEAGPLPTPACGANGGVALGRSTVPRDRNFLWAGREENVRLSLRRSSGLRAKHR